MLGGDKHNTSPHPKGPEMDQATADAVKAASGAIAETAKLGGKVVDAGTGFAGWLKDTFGTIPQDLLGIAGGDWLHHQRRRNLLAMEAKTEAIRQRIGAGPPCEPSVSVVLPLLQFAADESRPELQDLWAALLASSMQPDGGTRVRRAFFEVLGQMEPDDARILQALMLTWQNGSVRVSVLGDHVAGLGIDRTAVAVAVQALVRLGLIQENAMLEIYLTQFGTAFWRACNP